MQKYSEQELNSLIAEVEREFTMHFAKSAGSDSLKLAKSEDESEKKKDESKEENKPKETEPKKEEDKSAQEPKKEESKEMPPKDGESKEEKTSEQPPSQEKPSEESPENQGDEAHGYDDEDMQALHNMYSTMKKGELKVHHDSIRKCMDGMGLAKCEDSMAKSEKDVVIEIKPSEEVSLLKSELEAAKADNGNLKKNLDAVEAFLKKFVEKTAPVGKAVTSLDVIAKTEGANKEKPLQKGEIDAKLSEKAKNPSLSKADRDAINSYYCGSKNIEKVRHLLN